MRFLARVVLPCALGVAALVMLPSVRAQTSQTSQSSASSPAANAPAPEQFNGVWDYNADESINVATGRPEQAPASARRTAPRQGSTPDPTGGARPGSGQTGGGLGPRGTGAPGGGGLGPGAGDLPQGFGETVPFRDFLQAELRALARDLLEVPESLRFDVTPAAVTITDDLGRAMVLPTSAGDQQKPQKYQVSASRFEARAVWAGAVLRKEISGVRGFKMTETFTLSQDGRRLFVIVRVGDEKPGTRPVGANRVYDRIDPDTRGANDFRGLR